VSTFIGIVTNNTVYGKLYNWYAVKDSRGLAPAGWHIPTDSEWDTIITCLGGETVAGGKMKETGNTHWISPNTAATNSSGFTGVPGGCRAARAFSEVGYSGYCWSYSEYGSNGTAFASFFTLSNDTGRTGRSSDWKDAGLSVRFVKD
jgi:uncharacterized protein (TIGR02145 family)